MQGQCGLTNYCYREQEKVVGLAGQIIGVCYAHALLHAIIGGCGYDLPKSGAAMADPAAPLPTPLCWEFFAESMAPFTSSSIGARVREPQENLMQEENAKQVVEDFFHSLGEALQHVPTYRVCTSLL